MKRECGCGKDSRTQRGRAKLSGTRPHRALRTWCLRGRRSVGISALECLTGSKFRHQRSDAGLIDSHDQVTKQSGRVPHRPLREVPVAAHPLIPREGRAPDRVTIFSETSPVGKDDLAELIGVPPFGRRQGATAHPTDERAAVHVPPCLAVNRSARVLSDGKTSIPGSHGSDHRGWPCVRSTRSPLCIEAQASERLQHIGPEQSENIVHRRERGRAENAAETLVRSRRCGSRVAVAVLQHFAVDADHRDLRDGTESPTGPRAGPPGIVREIRARYNRRAGAT